MADNEKPRGWEAEFTDGESALYRRACRRVDKASEELDKKYGVKKHGVDLYSQVFLELSGEHARENKRIQTEFIEDLERLLPQYSWSV